MNTEVFMTGRRGECDICHDAPVTLWQPEDDEPGDWEYCESCITKLVNRRKRREVSADETRRREDLQAPRIGYPGADQMMRWQRDYK